MAREHIGRWKIGDVEVVRIVEIFEATGVNPILFQNRRHERVFRHADPCAAVRPVAIASWTCGYLNASPGSRSVQVGLPGPPHD